MNDIEQEYLFVYGSLGRATHSNNTPHHMHSILTTFATYVSKAVFCGKMYFVAQYPGVIESDSEGDAVLGEVYALTTNPQRNNLVWKILDEYEGNDGTEDALYIRKKSDVILLEDSPPNAGQTSTETTAFTRHLSPSSKRLQAWVYCYNRSVEALERIVTGDFAHPFVA